MNEDLVLRGSKVLVRLNMATTQPTDAAEAWSTTAAPKPILAC